MLAILRAVRMTPRMILRGLLKFAAVVTAAGAVGAGLGIALAELSGDDDAGTAIVPQTTSAAPPRTTPAVRTTRGTATAPAATRGRTTRVQIQSAVLYPASTPTGRAQRRARVVVRARVTSRSPSTIGAQVPRLLVGTHTVRNDPRSADAAGALLRALGPGASASGELRFETIGTVTEALTARPRARLRIAGRTVSIGIRISSRPPPEN